MFYITGDTHRNFQRIEDFCASHKTTKKNDTMIIIGDVAINYFEDEADAFLKQRLSKLTITFFCLHGNHECRPQNIASYELREWHGGKVWVEKRFPNLLFAKDGEVYDFDGQSVLVIGGAYSVDKEIRLARGWHWWADEQPSEEVKKEVEDALARLEYKVDIVLSHTCPAKYIPTEMFISGLDQSKVDNSTEEWLDTIEAATTYNLWYCGHYHTDKFADNVEFMFGCIEKLGLGRAAKDLRFFE